MLSCSLKIRSETYCYKVNNRSSFSYTTWMNINRISDHKFQNVNKSHYLYG